MIITWSSSKMHYSSLTIAHKNIKNEKKNCVYMPLPHTIITILQSLVDIIWKVKDVFDSVDPILILLFQGSDELKSEVSFSLMNYLPMFIRHYVNIAGPYRAWISCACASRTVLIFQAEFAWCFPSLFTYLSTNYKEK